jgi:hypothetical protein
MAKLKASFHYSIEFQVSNGKRTIFWDDYWLEYLLQQLYPMLYRQSTQQNYTVEEIYYGGQCQLLFHTDSSEIQDQI